jgi:IS5 family transposase
MGAPAKAIRLMVGLHYLKHTFNVSDESVIEQWIENPYWVQPEIILGIREK